MRTPLSLSYTQLRNAAGSQAYWVVIKSEMLPLQPRVLFAFCWKAPSVIQVAIIVLYLRVKFHIHAASNF